MPDIDIDHLKTWTGKAESAGDVILPGPVEALWATLDRDGPAPAMGQALPPLWHWLFFLGKTPRRDLGRDGHAALGGFLPPVPLPRRMWAGGRLGFDRPLEIGTAAVRTSVVADVSLKQGRTGPLAFVLVRHTVADSTGRYLVEEHDIVYRDRPAPGAPAPKPKPAPAAAQFSKLIEPDPVLLFRYSALTFNGHRIHYDRDFCIREEGYPGLVFHGPLTATLLMELLTDNCDLPVRRFAFKAVSPLFDTKPFRIEGRVDGGEATLWALTPEGHLAMEATAEVGS